MAKQSLDLNEQVERWLTNLGFSLGNPFATVVAEQERELLPRFFVNIPGIDYIQGKENTVVFAPRGAGKSALRIMLSEQTAPRNPRSNTLSVEFTDFDDLLTLQYQQLTVDTFAATTALLKAGARVLLSVLCETNILDSKGVVHKQSSSNEQRPAAFVQHNLAQFLNTYAPNAFTPTALYARFNQLTEELSLESMSVSWPQFVQHVQEKTLTKLINANTEDRTAIFFAALSDLRPEETADPGSTRLEKLQDFIDACRALGFESVYFLFDRIDEFPETINSVQAQADLLTPFWGHFGILETPYLVFKFFLPETVKEVLENRGLPWAKQKGLIKSIYLNWADDRLLELLNERIRTYSSSQYTDIAQICEDDANVDRTIESGLLAAAQGSPRRLLLAAQVLCEAHVRERGIEKLLLKQADWGAAVPYLREKKLLPEQYTITHKRIQMAPSVTSGGETLEAGYSDVLRLQLAKRVAWLGENAIDLTPIQYKILKTLVDAGDRCDRDTLAEKVWGNKHGVSEETIDRNISRLREKLRASGGEQSYVETIRGWGFQLKHYIQVE